MELSKSLSVGLLEVPPVTGNHVGSAAKVEKHERTRTIRGVAAFMAAVTGLLAIAFVVVRSADATKQSNATLACAAKLYSPYDPKNLQQCMAVCLTCSAGVQTTCSTSCTLKGAR